MKVQPGNGKGKKDLSLALLHGEAVSSSVESAGCAYQSPSVIAAGADAGGVQLLSTLTNLVLSIMLIKVPSLVEGKHNALKGTTIKIALFSAFTWLPIVFVMSFFRRVDPLLLTGLWIFGLVPTVLLYPLRDNWVASLVPGEKMGRYLSWRSAIAGAVYLGSNYGMAWLIDRTSGGGFRAYGFVLAIAFLASTISIALYWGVRPPPTHEPSPNSKEAGFVSFLKSSRTSHLGTFIIFVSLYTLAVNLAGPLFASYMLNDLKFNMMTYTAIVSCEYIARIISLTYWGKQVDRSGSLRIMSIVAYLIPIVPILWVFSANFLYLCAIQMFSGAVWAAFDLSTQTFIYKATAPAQRLRYIVYHRSLTTFSASMGTLLGMLLLGRMFRINGSAILTMFLISGVLRLVIARIMLPRLTPEGIPDAVVHPELARELANPAVTPRIGLYYDPQAFRNFSRRAASVGGNIIGNVGKVTVSRNGLFYKPWRWAEFVTGSGSAENATRLKKGLYNKPEEWAEIQREVALALNDRHGALTPVARDGLYHNQQEQAEIQNALLAARQEEPEAATREGLYYDPEQRAELQKELTAARKSAEPAVKKQGLFHTPELWAGIQKQLGIAAKAESPTIRREGLFNMPERWTDYLQQSMVLDTVTTRSGGEGPVMRQGIFGHPELWEKYQKDTARIAASKPQLRPQVTRSSLLRNSEQWQKYREKTAVSRPAPRVQTALLISSNASKTRPVVARPVAAQPGSVRRLTPRATPA